MKFNNIYFIIFCFSILLLVGCKSKEENNNQETVYKEKGENFNTFYSRFISDQKFQISRVTFPLQCSIYEANKEINTLYKKDWIPMKVHIDKVDTKTYTVKKKETATEVNHRIYIENSEVDILTKYSKIKGKWYLVYYKNVML